MSSPKIQSIGLVSPRPGGDLLYWQADPPFPWLRKRQMQIVLGDLWSELGKADLLLVTTNSTLNSRGDLIMGAGSALQAKRHFPQLPRLLGEKIRTRAGCRYGVVCSGLRFGNTEIGAFQTKTNPFQPSDTETIYQSVRDLTVLTLEYGRIAMPFPGINNGRLSPYKVYPLLEGLPSNVHIYVDTHIPGITDP